MKKIKNFLNMDKYIIKWIIISFCFVFIIVFLLYINNDAKNGAYPEKDFGSLKELKKELNPYLNIYRIKQVKSVNNIFLNKEEKFGFGFIATDNDEGGALVVKVYPGSDSEKSGLQVGDIIVFVNNEQVLSNSQLGELIDSEYKVNLIIQRENQTLNIIINKGPFVGEEGLKVGTSEWVPTSENIPSKNTLDQVNYGLDKLKNGLVEYSVEGISFFGAMIIAFLWAATILPVLILGIIFYKLLSKIRHKIFIILINIVSILFIMCGVMFLLSQNIFFDEMVRESINIGGGFIDLSMLIYPFVAIILSLFLSIGYTITLFVHKKYLLKQIFTDNSQEI